MRVKIYVVLKMKIFANKKFELHILALNATLKEMSPRCKSI